MRKAGIAFETPLYCHARGPVSLLFVQESDCLDGSRPAAAVRKWCRTRFPSSFSSQDNQDREAEQAVKLQAVEKTLRRVLEVRMTKFFWCKIDHRRRRSASSLEYSDGTRLTLAAEGRPGTHPHAVMGPYAGRQQTWGR